MGVVQVPDGAVLRSGDGFAGEGIVTAVSVPERVKDWLVLGLPLGLGLPWGWG